MRSARPAVGESRTDRSTRSSRSTSSSGLIHETLSRNPDLDPNEIDDLVLGCVTPIGDQGGCLPRTAAVLAGLPYEVPGFQLNRFCASALEAVNVAGQKVRSGWEELIMAGGVESMSRVPMGSDGGPWYLDPETNYDTSFVPQGISADLIATLEGFSREDVDAYAARSQERAATAQAEGRFKDSVVPVRDINDNVVLDHDEFIRPGTTVETLGKLKPSFAAIGEMGGFDAVATAEVPLGREDRPRPHAGQLARGSSTAPRWWWSATRRPAPARPDAEGADPRRRVHGRRADDHAHRPRARRPARRCAKAGLTIDDIDLIEMNEAFAAVVLRFMKDMDVDPDKVNVNGGAIAMGHPLGATGAMILGTLIDELHRTGGRYGLATLCIGGGMGTATIVEAL